MTDSAAPIVSDADRPVPLTDFERRFKHPPGLAILFFSEMWERFSYYGMRGLLKLYMANYLFVTMREGLQGCRQKLPPCGLIPGDPSRVFLWSGLQQILPHNPAEVASLLYGAYTALVYATPLIGGIVADRWLGQRKTVVVGSLLIAAGHFVLALENAFFLGLVLIILGTGAFKPNVSTQVGNLYAQGDRRRDGAFTIFYMGINLGAFISNLVCGTLAALHGWHWGFAASGVGMLLGLAVYLRGAKHLGTDNLSARRAAHKAERQPLTADEKRRSLALVALCALNVVFWAVYEQQGNTMQSWADDRTQWPIIAGFQIPSTWFQSFNPLMIILFAPLLDLLWGWQGRRNREPSSVTKMAIGCFILGASFLVMIAGAQALGGAKGSPVWPLLCTLLLTIGELYMSPIGLSLVTKVSPARIVSMMMGMWFLSSFVGNFLSGAIGVLYTRWPNEAFFLLLTGLGLGSGVAIWAFNRPLRAAVGNQ
jgi:POT family proton-dependent oligopeptide transporter